MFLQYSSLLSILHDLMYATCPQITRCSYRVIVCIASISPVLFKIFSLQERTIFWSGNGILEAIGVLGEDFCRNRREQDCKIAKPHTDFYIPKPSVHWFFHLVSQIAIFISLVYCSRYILINNQYSTKLYKEEVVN